MNLTFVTWNLFEGGITNGSDTRLRRQMRRLAAESPDVVMLQELTGFDRDGCRLMHLAEDLLGGMRGFLALSPHSCHLGVFIRPSVGLRVVRQRHEQRMPYWHGVACVTVDADGFGPLLLASAHLAPSSPAQRLIEAEAFKLIAEAGPLIVAGDWNAIPVADPHPEPCGDDAEHIRRKLDRAPARALEATGLTDIAAQRGDPTPTVGYTSADRLTYRCDRYYTSLPAVAVTGYRVITDADAESDHRPVIAEFDLALAGGGHQ